MNNLLNAESAFCEELAVGVETYVDPLRRILPESIHTAMFLGLTEVYKTNAFRNNHNFNLLFLLKILRTVVCHLARDLI